MNKYFILIIVAVFILLGGVLYRIFLLPESSKPITTDVVRHIVITAEKDAWRFTPEDIDIDRGDRVEIDVLNEDDYDHGLAIDAYGISQRLPAKSTTHISFVATQAGDFPFYCSVPCGEGIVDGVNRTHFDMIGKLHVKGLPNEFDE